MEYAKKIVKLTVVGPRGTTPEASGVTQSGLSQGSGRSSPFGKNLQRGPGPRFGVSGSGVSEGSMGRKKELREKPAEEGEEDEPISMRNLRSGKGPKEAEGGEGGSQMPPKKQRSKKGESAKADAAKGESAKGESAKAVEETETPAEVPPAERSTKSDVKADAPVETPPAESALSAPRGKARDEGESAAGKEEKSLEASTERIGEAVEKVKSGDRQEKVDSSGVVDTGKGTMGEKVKSPSSREKQGGTGTEQPKEPATQEGTPPPLPKDNQPPPPKQPAETLPTDDDPSPSGTAGEIGSGVFFGPTNPLPMEEEEKRKDLTPERQAVVQKIADKINAGGSGEESEGLSKEEVSISSLFLEVSLHRSDTM